MADGDVICRISANPDISGIGVRASVYAQAFLAALNITFIIVTAALGEDGVEKPDDIELASVSEPQVLQPTPEQSGNGVEQAAPIELANESQQHLLQPQHDVELPTAVELHANEQHTLQAEPEQVPESIHRTENHDNIEKAKKQEPQPQPEPEFDSSYPFPKFLRNRASYIKVVKNLERSIFTVGFAVLVSAIIELRSGTLDPYHALVVLNISLINNWTGLLILVGRGGLRTANLPGWKGYVVIKKSWLLDWFWSIAHCTLLGAFGVYFWSRQSAFMAYATAQAPCLPSVDYWILRPVPLGDRTLQKLSVVFYAITTIPIIGLYFQGLPHALCMIVAAFVGPFVVGILAAVGAAIYLCILHPISQLLGKVMNPISQSHWIARMRSGFASLRSPFTRMHQSFSAFNASLSLRSGVEIATGAVFALTPIAPVVYMIISTEKVIQVNKVLVIDGEENDWTYGQTLALFSACVAFGLYGHDWWKALEEERQIWQRKNVNYDSDVNISSG